MKQVVIMPGGFHPFHAGHYALYKQAQEAFPGADVYVAATNDTSARPFPFAVKEKLAKLAGVAPGHFVQVKSPFQAREITANLDPENTQLIFVRSEKDANKPPQAGGVKKDGNPAYLQPYTGNDVEPMKSHAYMAYLPTVEFGPGMTSATEIRNAWPTLNEKRKTALVMSLYPKTQTNPKLASTVVKMLDTAIGGEELTEGSGSEFILYINDKPAAKYTDVKQAEQDLYLIKSKVPSAKFEIKQEVCNMVAVPTGLKEALLKEFAPGGNSASSYYAVTSNFVKEFVQQKQEELQDLIDAGWTKQDLAQAGTLEGNAADIEHFEQVRDRFLKGLKPGFDAYLRGDTQMKDQLGAYWIENDLPLNQDWESIYGEPWGDDGLDEGSLNEFAPGNGDDGDRYVPPNFGKPYKSRYLRNNQFDIWCETVPGNPSKDTQIKVTVDKSGLDFDGRYWFIDSPGGVHLRWKYGEIPLPGALDQAGNPGHIHDLISDFLNKYRLGDLQNVAKYYGFTSDGQMNEQGVAEEVAQPVEAYGYAYNRRDQRVMWRKVFPSEQAAQAWADSKNATILGTKPVQQTVDEDYVDEKK